MRPCDQALVVELLGLADVDRHPPASRWASTSAAVSARTEALAAATMAAAVVVTIGLSSFVGGTPQA